MKLGDAEVKFCTCSLFEVKKSESEVFWSDVMRVEVKCAEVT